MPKKKSLFQQMVDIGKDVKTVSDEIEKKKKKKQKKEVSESE